MDDVDAGALCDGREAGDGDAQPWEVGFDACEDIGECVVDVGLVGGSLAVDEFTVDGVTVHVLEHADR